MSDSLLFGLRASTPEISSRVQAQNIRERRKRLDFGGCGNYVLAFASFEGSRSSARQLDSRSPFHLWRHVAASTIKPIDVLYCWYFDSEDSAESITSRLSKCAPWVDQLRASGVVSADWQSVEKHLNGRSNLADLISEISSACRQEFGSDAEIALELYADPEIDDRYITLYIRLKQYTSESLGQIVRLSDRFEARLQDADGYLLITTDFRSPGENNAI
jgi:hypothetical protein